MSCVRDRHVIVAISLALSGCGLAAQQADLGQTAAIDCYERVESDPTYAPLRGKTAIAKFATPSLEMLSDQRRPTPQEVTLVHKLHKEIGRCRTAALSSAGHPALSAALSNHFASIDRTWAGLVSGSMTWGQFNQARQAAQLDLDRGMAAAEQQVMAERQAEAADMAERMNAVRDSLDEVSRSLERR